ncbi:hypothetical protein Scep_026499 [Stephania cephalantha]|uniref:Ankyrin repeat-containing protein BDA1-like n=1 Tax=Stephania cephalantha TaxID=152367 RepID=A0AAP0EMU3_9MAGN
MLTSTSAALKVRIEELLFTLQLLQMSQSWVFTNLNFAVHSGTHKLQMQSIAGPLVMEQTVRLFEAARLGSVEASLEVLVDDPLILERVPLTQDTPLHVALKIDSSLCSLKDRDGRTPIHLAAVKGRLDVMVELLSTCPELAREVTVQGETIFHLVVKSNQFEGFKVLLEKVGFHYLLSFKDQDGNTILHLAVCRKQIQTVELLLNSKSERMVEVNAKNLNNLTAMDQSSCDEGYFIIGWLLLRAIERCAKSQETIEVTISHDQMERANSVTR